MNPTLVLLAAGLSTRFGRLKQLEPLGPSGEALLDYAVFDAWRAGFTRIVLIIREELEDQFRAHIKGRWPGDLRVVYHHQKMDDLPGGPGEGASDIPTPLFPGILSQRTKPWGTAHALLTARALLPESFVVLNADDFYGESAFTRAASLLSRGMPVDRSDLPVFGLVAYTLTDTLSEHGGVSRGICRVDSLGHLEGVEEILDIRLERGGIFGTTVSGEGVVLGGNERTSTNFWIFTPEVFPLLQAGLSAFIQGLDSVRGKEPEFLIPLEINRILLAGEARVRVYPAKDPFFGITHPEDRGRVMETLETAVQEGRYPRSLWGEG